MQIILTESKCKECHTKLSHYEMTEKEGLCMSCYKETQTPISRTAFVIPKKTVNRRKAI